jgi:hypothetical protein
MREQRRPTYPADSAKLAIRKSLWTATHNPGPCSSDLQARRRCDSLESFYPHIVMRFRQCGRGTGVELTALIAGAASHEHRRVLADGYPPGQRGTGFRAIKAWRKNFDSARLLAKAPPPRHNYGPIGPNGGSDTHFIERARYHIRFSGAPEKSIR